MLCVFVADHTPFPILVLSRFLFAGPHLSCLVLTSVRFYCCCKSLFVAMQLEFMPSIRVQDSLIDRTPPVPHANVESDFIL